MTKYLITPTLINAYQYYINDEFKSPADSRADFLKTLSREKFEPNEAMQKGIDFEEEIFTQCSLEKEVGKKLTSNPICDAIVKIVKGGIWQQTCKKDLQVGNQEFLVYGKIDVVKQDTVYDIKFTSNYELGKFLNSAQHLIYLYCTGLPKFQYLISDGKDYWIEDYYNHANIENEIKSKISDLLGYLENDMEAKKLFETKWGAKND
jgi:hypothetical protein